MGNRKSAKREKLTLKGYYESLGDPRKKMREDIASGCGVTIQTVYRWINGESTPNKLQKEKISEILGVEVGSLFTEKEVTLC